MKNMLNLLSLAFLIACGNINSKIIEDVSVEDFCSLIDKGDGIIIDVRTIEEFTSGHISDATNIDYYSEEFLNKLNIVRKDIPIYVYCRSGGRSSSAANKMEKLGFTKIYNLVGGIGTWESEGYKIIRSEKEKILKQPKVTQIQLNKLLNENNIVLIGFTTQWCVPCRKMKPVIEEIKVENPHVKVLFIDADTNKDLVKKYAINGVPVFILFDNQKEVFRNVGIISKEELAKKINYDKKEV